MPRKSRVPAYSLHRASGQARVRIDGQDHYLGLYDSTESRNRYQRLIDRWTARRQAKALPEISVGQLALLYLNHAESYYVKDGRQTSEVHCIRTALRPLAKLFRNSDAADFGPIKLRRVRDEIIKTGCCRRSVNGAIHRIVRAFRWAVSQEYVQASVLTALEALEGLRSGRTTVRESEPVLPVPIEVVEATLPHLGDVPRMAVKLQLFTGMRPAEVVSIRACDLNMSSTVWEYRPKTHKMIHRGRSRVICIGPQAQVVIRELLTSSLGDYLLPASDSGRARPYTTAAYRRHITRACELAFGMPKELRDIASAVRKVPEAEREPLRRKLRKEAAAWRREHCWHPNQLRHTFATLARREAGIEAARVTLGHSSAVTSEIYAERDLEQARKVVARIG